MKFVEEDNFSRKQYNKECLS